MALALGPLAARAEGVCAPADAGCGADPAAAMQCGLFPLHAGRVRLPAEAAASNLVEVDSDRVDSRDGQRYVLKGHVRLQQGPQVLRAGEVVWLRSTGAFTADEHVRYQNASLLLKAPHMHGDSQAGSGEATDVTFQLRDSRGNGRASRILWQGDATGTLDNVAYSTCSPERREWELRAERIEIDQNKEVGYAHDVSMRLAGVPILWFPWLRFPTTDRRQTGFLYPTLGYDDTRGIDLTWPFYLNLAPNYDATLYPRIMGHRGTMLGAEFRYLGQRSKGIFRADYLPDDKVTGDSRSLVRARSTTLLGGPWRFNLNIDHVSDRSYFEDLGSSLYSNATHLLHSSAYVSGRGHGWYAAIGADQYQITDPELRASYEPYKRLPRAVFDARGYIGRSVAWGVDSEFIRFHKDRGLNGSRLDLMPWIDWNLQGPWWQINPHLAWRATSYKLDRNDDASPSRQMPIASVDAGLVFERATSLFDKHYTQTLEPRLFYLWVPWRDQHDIPIFDTSYQTFGYWQMFSRNRFSGPDRQMNANNLTLALTSRLLDSSGVERFAASLGQIRFFDPQRVQLPGRPVTDYSGSAYVARFSSRLSDRWQLRLAQQWNPHNDHTELSTVSLQHRMRGRGVLNLSYRYRRNYLEQVDFSTLWPLDSRWNLVARWNYSMDQDRTLEALGGIEYNSCCLAIRLVGRHYIRNSEGDTSNSIMLQIEFKGLGSVGRDTGGLLRHAILGYRQAQRPIWQDLNP